MENDKIPSNKHNKEVQDLYTENYKILLIEIKGLYKERTSSCSWIRKFHITKKAILFKLVYKFNAVPMKILAGFFWVEFDSWS